MDPFAVFVFELGCLAATTLSTQAATATEATPTGWVSGNPQGGGMGSGNGGGGMGGLGGLGIGGCGMGGAGSCGIGGMTAASPQEQVVPAAKSAGQHYEGYQPQSLEQQPHGYPPQGLFVEQPGDDANGSGSSMSNLASDLALERRTEMAGGEPSPLRSTPPQKLEPRPQQQLAPDATLAFAALAQGRPCLPRQAQLARPSSISSAELPLSRCRGFSL